MANPTPRHLALTILIIIIQIGGSNRASAQECGSYAGLAVLLACQDFITKDAPEVPPSPECCAAVHAIGLTCSCKFITKEIKVIISVKKVVSVAKTCGKPIPSGTQCGSYKVPMA